MAAFWASCIAEIKEITKRFKEELFVIAYFTQISF